MRAGGFAFADSLPPGVFPVGGPRIGGDGSGAVEPVPRKRISRFKIGK